MKKNNGGLSYTLSKLCFFSSSSGGFKKLAYRALRIENSTLDCNKCHFRERCVKQSNITRFEKGEENGKKD